MDHLNTGLVHYSQGSNTEYSNSESIRKPNVLKVGNQMVQTIRKPNYYHSKTELFKMAALVSVVSYINLIFIFI